MLRNYLTSLQRYISRNKAFTTINVLGLVIGMTAFMLIGQYFLHETSYDQFWGHSDRVYRVHLERYNKGQLETQWAAGAAGIGPDLVSNFPEVEAKYDCMKQIHCYLMEMFSSKKVLCSLQGRISLKYLNIL